MAGQRPKAAFVVPAPPSIAQIQPRSVAPLLTRLADAKPLACASTQPPTNPKPGCMRAANAPQPTGKPNPCKPAKWLTHNGLGLSYSHRPAATVPPACPLRYQPVMPVASPPLARRSPSASLQAHSGGSGGFARGFTHYAALRSFRLWATRRTKTAARK